MGLNLPQGERRQLFFEVGGRVLEVADAVSDLQVVEWEKIRADLNPALVDRARELHEGENMRPVDAIIKAAREWTEEQLMELAAQSAQPFGE